MKLLLENWRKFIAEDYEPVTTLRIFDFDETIAHTESETRVTAPDGSTATLRDQQEFEEYMFEELVTNYDNYLQELEDNKEE